MRLRLRALFQPTDGERQVEELIATRGRELQERTAQLTEALGDLERREERTHQLRNAVERMLRSGAAELDERHSQLNSLAAELSAHDAALRELDAELTERKQELGAVELHRAALERRERTLEERSEMLERLAAEISEREQRLREIEQSVGTAADRDRELAERETQLATFAGELGRRREELAVLASTTTGLRSEVEAAHAALDDRAAELTRVAEALAAREAESRESELAREPAPESAHLLFVPDDRYRLVEVDGPAPSPGSELELDGAHYQVVRVGSSPLPADRRRCAFLELAASPVEPSP